MQSTSGRQVLRFFAVPKSLACNMDVVFQNIFLYNYVSF